MVRRNASLWYGDGQCQISLVFFQRPKQKLIALPSPLAIQSFNLFKSFAML